MKNIFVVVALCSSGITGAVVELLKPSQLVLIKGKSTGDVCFALARDELGAVTFTPVVGLVEVGGDRGLRRKQEKTLSPGDRGEGSLHRNVF
jgi:hypothetical protein